MYPGQVVHCALDQVGNIARSCGSRQPGHNTKNSTHHPLIFVQVQVLPAGLGVSAVTVTVLRVVRVLYPPSPLVGHFGVRV